MHTLVLADTNLAVDTRMKRHIRTLLDLGQRVTAVISAGSSPAPGMQAAGLDVILWRCPELTLRADLMHSLATELGLMRFLVQVFPGVLTPGAFHALGPLSARLQARQLADDRWDEFRNPVCAEGTAPAEDYRQLCCLFEHMLQWAAFACTIPADCVYCVDLPTLLAGVAHKLKHHSRLIFDAHEIFYDMAPGLYSRLWKQTLALLEWHLVGQADCVMGVSQSHADWMRRTYDLPADRVLCVPNCFAMGQEVGPPPPRKPATPLRVYYHGSSDPYRGLDAIARAVAAVPETCLVLRCPPSPTVDEVRRLAGELGMGARFKHLPLVPPDQMIDAVRAEADVGIHVTCDLPVALNLKVALTNKFIEYLTAGIPVLTAPLQEQARIVREHDVGYVLADNSVEGIRRGLLWAVANRPRLPDMGLRAHQAGVAHFGWKAIRQTLEQALCGGPRGPAGRRPGCNGHAPGTNGLLPRDRADTLGKEEEAFWWETTRALFEHCGQADDLRRTLRNRDEELGQLLGALGQKEAELERLYAELRSPACLSKRMAKALARHVLRVPWRALPVPVRTRLRPAVNWVLGRH